MNIFSLKNLCRFRLVFTFVFLLIFAGLFSGWFRSRSDMFNLAQWQFLPKVLSMVALSGITTLGVMLAVAMITSMFGRAYCSWICPLGWMQDLLERLDHKFIRPQRKRKYRKISHVFRISCFVVTAIWFFSGFAAVSGWVEPYTLFGKISTGVFRGTAVLVSRIFNLQQNGADWNTLSMYLAASSGILLALVVLVFFKGRIFCNTICPAGSILAAIASRSGKRLNINSERCINCGKCVQNCNAHCINIS
jgi:polyferredoxin